MKCHTTYLSFIFVLIFTVVENNKKISYRNTPEKIFAGCLSTKFCYSPEDHEIAEEAPNCVEEAGCNNLVAFGGMDENDNNKDTYLVIEMYAHSKAWFSIGFSKDKFMGDDYVISCLRPNISTITNTIIIDGDVLPNVTNSWNKAVDVKPVGRDNKIIKEMDNIIAVQTLAGKRAIYCKFYVKKKFTKRDPFEHRVHTYDLTTKYYLLAAWSDKYNSSNTTDIYQLADHDGVAGKDNGVMGGRAISKDPMSFDMFYQPSTEQKTYFKIHGICMILTWIFFVSVGNFVGCFYKEIYRKKETCKVKTWLLLHCGFHGLALMPMGLGIYLHIIGRIGWESHVGRHNLHLVTGYSVITLYGISFLTGLPLATSKSLNRPEHKDKVHYPTFIHKITSHAAHFLSNIVLASSQDLQFSGLSCHFSYVAVSWMIVYIFLCVLMIFHRFWGTVLAEESENNPLDQINSLLTDCKHDTQEQPETLRLKTIVLCVFAILSFLVAVSLIAMLLWPPVGPCFNNESDHFFQLKSMDRHEKQTLDPDVDYEEKPVPETIRPFIPPIPTQTTTENEYRYVVNNN